MKDLLAFLDGKKTYLIVALAIVYLFGGDQGWWVVNENILGILGFGGLASARAGMSKVKANVPAIALCGAILVLGVGCKGVAPGSDPVVVRAEQVTEIAMDTFDSFLQWEYRNRDTGLVTGDVHAVAQEIRRNGINWLVTAREATKAYKKHRTEANKANLETAVRVLEALIRDAQKYL